MQAFTKIGLEALLTPDNCVVVLIDHQPFQLANVNSFHCYVAVPILLKQLGIFKNLSAAIRR